MHTRLRHATAFPALKTFGYEKAGGQNKEIRIFVGLLLISIVRQERNGLELAKLDSYPELSNVILISARRCCCDEGIPTYSFLYFRDIHSSELLKMIHKSPGQRTVTKKTYKVFNLNMNINIPPTLNITASPKQLD